MGKRPSKPTQLRVLESSRDEHGIKPEDTLEREPTPEVIEPECPFFIDDDAKAVWDKLAPKLVKLNLLTEVDGAVFGMLCQQIARIGHIHELIAAKSKSLVQRRYYHDGEKRRVDEKPSVYVTMEKQYYPIFRMFAKEFGLTPVGRVGLTVGKTNKDDDGADLLS